VLLDERQQLLQPQLVAALEKLEDSGTPDSVNEVLSVARDLRLV